MHSGPVIVDFDETLYLQNSTEDFINAASPGYLAAILLRVLKIAFFWIGSDRYATRDIWRVRVVMVLFPWTVRRWKKLCRTRGAKLTNKPLLDALLDRGQPFIVASIGFSAIIKPLLEAMGCKDVQLIACDLNRRSDRTGGKLALIEAAIGADALAGAMFITDSAADGDVLRCCAKPCLTQWSGAKFRRAFRQIYLPGDYLVYVKRPMHRAPFLRLLTDDLALWILVSLTVRPPGFLGLIGVVLLFFSLWSVYDIGYQDNDLCAMAFETNPVVSKEFADFDMRHFQVKAWISAFVLGLGGVLAIRSTSLLAPGLTWLGILLGLRGVYYLYNRVDKATRIWIYLVLHIFRSLALAMIVPVGIIGILACITQIISRWQAYFIYRYIRAFDVFNWPEINTHMVQLACFLLCLGALAFSHERVNLLTWPTAMLVAWSLFLARGELMGILKDAYRIDADTGRRKTAKSEVDVL